MPAVVPAQSRGWIFRCFRLTLAFLISTAAVPTHGYTRHQDSANDSATKPCCDSGGTVSIPIDIDRALDQTLEDILDEAESTLERFNTLRLKSDLFLGLNADVDDRVIHRFGMLVRKLSQLISELRAAPNAALPDRLLNQAAILRSDAIRLFIAARRLDLLMQARDRCGLRNLGIFLSAVETLALEPETGQTGTVAPTLHYFFFEGQLPNVVPPGGGWLILSGSGLWREDAPHVSLIDPERNKTVAVLDARQTGANATAAIKIEPEWIADNAGRCLSLEAGNKAVNGMPWGKQPEPAAYSHLPICIPQSFDTTYRMAGFLEYQTPTQTRHLRPKEIVFENASCVDSKQVSESLEWSLFPGAWLVDTGESSLYEAGTSSIDCKLSEDRIHCSGNLEKAVCGQTLHTGNTGDATDLLLEQTEWEHVFSPIEEYPLEEEHRSRALSEVVELKSPATEVSVLIPREEPSEQTTIWYELIAINGGQQKTVFVSPRKTLLEMEQDTYTTDHNQMKAYLDPAPESAEAWIHVSIDPATCPY
jgi:hypothetical protein